MTDSQGDGLLGKLKNCLSRQKNSQLEREVVHHQHHGISSKQLSANARKVIDRLKKAGFDAFLVGGGVRDLLLQGKPKDFDIVSNATPEQVCEIFRNSRIIGRRFRIAHVYFHREIIEVSTFRAGAAESEKLAAPLTMIRHDNTFGTIEEDALRRDFTVNALFFDAKDESIIDFVDGVTDIKRKKIRMIGDPVQRFHEDPVRLLRAIRLAAKLDFDIEKTTQKALLELGHLLVQVPAARLLDEVIKLFFAGSAWKTFHFLKKTNYIRFLFPALNKLLEEDKDKSITQLLDAALKATDTRFHEQRRLTPGYLIAVFLWPVFIESLQQKNKAGVRFYHAFPEAMEETIKKQTSVCMLTHRMTAMLRGMWTLQFHLERRRKRRVYSLFSNRYFRAAFDLLELRAKSGKVPQSLVDWWATFQTSDATQRDQMLAELD